MKQTALETGRDQIQFDERAKLLHQIARKSVFGITPDWSTLKLQRKSIARGEIVYKRDSIRRGSISFDQFLLAPQSQLKA